MSILIHILLALNVLVALLIIFVTLMQRPKQEGLGAAFGGGMTENLFGAQTTNVLATITRWLGGIFFAISLLISILYARPVAKCCFQQALLNTPKPPLSPEASPAASPAASAPATPAAPAASPAESAPQAAAPAAPSATPEIATPATPAPSPNPSGSGKP